MDGNEECVWLFKEFCFNWNGFVENENTLIGGLC